MMTHVMPLLQILKTFQSAGTLHAIVTIRVIVHNMPAQETMSERHMFRGQ